MKRVLGLFLLVAACIGSYFAIAAVLWQQRAVNSFVPVPATIIHSQVRTHRSRRSTSYSPSITYSYRVNDRTYQSTRVLTFKYSTGNRPWVQGIVEGHPPGAVTEAYINPQRPNESILVREYLAIPYFLGLGTSGAALVGAILLFNLAGGRKSMAAVALDDSGWQLLLPTTSLRRDLRNALFWFLGWVAISVPLVGHWVLVAGVQRVESALLGGPCLGVLVVLLVILIRRWHISGRVSDFRVRVRPVPLLRGEVFSIQAEADAYSPLRIREMLAQVVCLEHYREKRGSKTRTGTRIKGQQSARLLAAAEVPAGQVVEGKGELFFDPGSWPPTTDISGFKGYPHYTWELRLVVHLEGAVDYRGLFPLEVD